MKCGREPEQLSVSHLTMRAVYTRDSEMEAFFDTRGRLTSSVNHPARLLPSPFQRADDRLWTPINRQKHSA